MDIVGVAPIAKLLIIRGPSGAGEATVARAVRAASLRPTAATARDHYKVDTADLRQDADAGQSRICCAR